MRRVVNVDSLGHVRYDAGIVVLIRGLKRSECASIAALYGPIRDFVGGAYHEV